MSNQYTGIVRNKYETLRETSERHTLNDEYELFVTAQLQTAPKSIPIKPRLKFRVLGKSRTVTEKRNNI